jgi:hypothetical protein
MLRIKQRRPYYVLPSQRYDLTTKPPSRSMQKDFTFFIKFKVEDEIKNQETPSSIMMRPGMHYGLTYNQVNGNISWEFWYERDNENHFGFITTELTPHKLTDEWIVIVRHQWRNKTFTMTLINKDGDVWSLEETYDGRLNDYTETPYNFGCGNYFQQVDDSHYFWGDYTMYGVGLIENVKYDDDAISMFMLNNENSTYELSKPIDDITFYFNFNEQNRYKVWDLSGHCNFLMLNMDVGK